MKHPFWLVNSSLLLLILIVVGFIVFTRQTIPQKLPIKRPMVPQAVTQQQPVDITKIYEEDLFNTYRETIKQVEQVKLALPVPTPPQPIKVEIPEEPKQPFLPPLDATLKGIMMVSDESFCTAMIIDNKTKQEHNYKIGDLLEDAQLVKIFPSKVLLIRSNGQQESLYLTEKDALIDPILSHQHDNWAHITRKKSSTEISIDPFAFVKTIPNLGLLFDRFDISTAYKDGKSIGCKLGKIIENSLAQALLFEPGDLILKVADLPIETIEQRMIAYEKITGKKVGDQFTLEISRKNSPLTLTVKLEDFENDLTLQNTQSTRNRTEETGILQGPSSEELELQFEAILKEKYAFAPTTQDLIIAQKKAMLNEGKEERLQDFLLADKNT